MVGNAVRDLLGYVVAGQLKPEMFAELVCCFCRSSFRTPCPSAC